MINTLECFKTIIDRKLLRVCRKYYQSANFKVFRRFNWTLVTPLKSIWWEISDEFFIWNPKLTFEYILKAFFCSFNLCRILINILYLTDDSPSWKLKLTNSFWACFLLLDGESWQSSTKLVSMIKPILMWHIIY